MSFGCLLISLLVFECFVCVKDNIQLIQQHPKQPDQLSKFASELVYTLPVSVPAF